MDHDRDFAPQSHFEGNDALPQPADDFYVTDFMSDHPANYLQQRVGHVIDILPTVLARQTLRDDRDATRDVGPLRWRR